jgi:hypothetical protein
VDYPSDEQAYSLSKDIKYVCLPDMQYLMSGLSLNLQRCADVLDVVLTAFNEKTGIPKQIVTWNAKGGNANEPLSFPDRGRFIIDLTQSMRPDKQTLWTATLLEKKDEKERAPVLFISMHSPSLDIPMRLEIPLRAVIKGGPALRETLLGITFMLFWQMTERNSSTTGLPNVGGTLALPSIPRRRERKSPADYFHGN